MRKRNTQIPFFYGFTDKNYIYVDEYGMNVNIDSEHSKIHDGDHYFFSDYYTVIGGASLNIGLAVGENEAHFVYAVNSDQAGFSLQSWRGATYNDDGTLLELHNNNDASSNVPTLVCRLNPTNISTASAVSLRRGYAGTATNPANRTGGSIARGQEVILRKLTKYLIRVTNLSTNANDIQIVFGFYETF